MDNKDANQSHCCKFHRCERHMRRRFRFSRSDWPVEQKFVVHQARRCLLDLDVDEDKTLGKFVIEHNGALDRKRVCCKESICGVLQPFYVIQEVRWALVDQDRESESAQLSCRILNRMLDSGAFRVNYDWSGVPKLFIEFVFKRVQSCGNPHFHVTISSSGRFLDTAGCDVYVGYYIVWGVHDFHETTLGFGRQNLQPQRNHENPKLVQARV